HRFLSVCLRAGIRRLGGSLGDWLAFDMSRMRDSLRRKQDSLSSLGLPWPLLGRQRSAAPALPGLPAGRIQIGARAKLAGLAVHWTAKDVPLRTVARLPPRSEPSPRLARSAAPAGATGD